MHIYIYICTSALLCIYMHRVKWIWSDYGHYRRIDRIGG